MRRVSSLLLSTVLFAAAACSDDAGSLLEPAGAARFSTTGCDVKTVAADTLYPDSHPDSARIQQAVDRAREVYLVQGEYSVHGTIRVPNCTRIYGDDSLTVITQEKSTNNVEGNYQEGSSVFNAIESSNGLAANVTVEKMKFRATYTQTNPDKPWEGSVARAALYVEGGTDITVQNIVTENMAVIGTGIMSPSETHLNSYIRVKNNIARGYAGGWGAMTFYWADSVTITGNRSDDFIMGVLVSGGNADPNNVNGSVHYYQSRTTPLLAKRILVQNNQIYDGGFRLRNADGSWEYTGGGIYFSMAEGAYVANNTVFRCADLCLDAEGSKDVEFASNDIGYATQIAMGIYYDCRNIKFVWNTVRQDSYWGGKLFGQEASHFAFDDPTRGPGRYSDDIQVHNNTLIWEGTDAGLSYKRHTSSFYFQNNTLEKVALRFTEEGAYNGYMEVTGNDLYLRDRVPLAVVNGVLDSVPAIDAGYNANNSIWVAGNYITSDVQQPEAGIRVRQKWGSSVSSWIHDNKVKNFANSIEFAGLKDLEDKCTQAHSFDVQYNTVTGFITDSSDPGCSSGIVANNQELADPSTF